jgi:hypothetical protein
MTFNRFIAKFCMVMIMIPLGYITCIMLGGQMWFGAFVFGIPTLVLFAFFSGILRVRTQAEVDAYVASRKGLRK